MDTVHLVMAQDFNQQLGKNVARMRAAAGLSQTELADRLTNWGLSFQQQTVLKVEKGTRPVRAEELYALSVILRVPMHVLATRSEDQERAQALKQLQLAEVQLVQLRGEVAELQEEIKLQEGRRQEAMSRLEALDAAQLADDSAGPSPEGSEDSDVVDLVSSLRQSVEAHHRKQRAEGEVDA